MLIIDFEATQARIKERCVALSRVATKYNLKKTSLQKFVQGRFYGTSGQGELGRCEQAMIDMDLLVYTVAEDLKHAA